MLGKIEGRRRKGQDGCWNHRLDGHEFEQAPGAGEGQGSLVCCSPWGRRVGHDCVSEQQQEYRDRKAGFRSESFSTLVILKTGITLQASEWDHASAQLDIFL